MKFFSVIIFLLFFSMSLAAQETETSIKIGDEAPVFSLPDMNNNYVFLRDYSGETLRKPWKNKTKHVIVVSFFATWCGPCKKEIPYLEKLQNEYTGKDAKFFLVDVGEEREKVVEFLQKNPIQLTVLHDRYQQTAEKYDAKSLPRLIVIDKNGKISLIKKGFTDGDSFLMEMRTLLDDLLK
ncbi:MAG: TlpA family protein disulfide reductase [Calditrichae bacterium]|nr:TlpA family protein disulfide reductase [Calditrichota bacterium]MCB9057501.1 TlpA family protein disulfide reductase [Calditrichia bacterium]